MAVVYNHFPRIAAGLPAKCKRVVVKTTKAIANDAQAFAPVDTGFMRESVYTVTSEGSTYGQGKATVRFTKSGKVTKKTRKNVYKATRQELLPEISEPVDDYTGYAAVGATYGIYPEYGTRFMPAQPYFTPAVEINRDLYDAELAVIFPELAGSISIL